MSGVVMVDIEGVKLKGYGFSRVLIKEVGVKAYSYYGPMVNRRIADVGAPPIKREFDYILYS